MLTRFRSPTRRNLEIQVQYKRNPARCQFTTVRGVTKTSGFLHPDQNVLNATQNNLCRAVNRVRGRCECNASSCRRRAKFSKTRSSRERKELMIHPRRYRSNTIMARILSELSEFSFALIHSFCRCTTFWRDTPQERRNPISGGGLASNTPTSSGFASTANDTEDDAPALYLARRGLNRGGSLNRRSAAGRASRPLGSAVGAPLRAGRLLTRLPRG